MYVSVYVIKSNLNQFQRIDLLCFQCSGAASGDFPERVAALLQSSSTQDDC